MFGKRVDQPEQAYRLSVQMSLQETTGHGGYLGVSQTFECGPLSVVELGQLLQRVGEAIAAGHDG